MSDLVAEAAEEEQTEAIPYLADKVKDWAVDALAIMSVGSAAYGIMVAFAEFCDKKYGTPKHIHAQLCGRLEEMKYNKRRPHRERIEARKEQLKIESSLLDDLPSLIEHVIDLERMLRFEALKPSERVRIILSSIKIREKIQGTGGLPGKREVEWSGSGADLEDE